MEFVQGSLGFLVITSEIAKWSKSLLQHPKKVGGGFAKHLKLILTYIFFSKLLLKQSRLNRPVNVYEIPSVPKTQSVIPRVLT